MLLPRLITAIIGIPLIVLSVYWGGIPFFVMMLGVTFLALREYFILTKMKYASQPVVGMTVGMILFVFMYLNGTSFGPLAENQGTVALLSLLLIPLFAREMFRSSPEKVVERLAITFFGVFLVAWTLGHLLLIRSIRPGGMQYMYFLFIVIWILDTGAYVVGKKFGRFKLAAMVSPKKTVEGAVGGVVTGILAAMLCRIIFMRDIISLPEAALLGLIISIISQFSDLSESLLKRDVGVKDSAQLLPGHGGMLDRFDSFLFAAPLLYYYLTIFKK
ncbi:MAG: phosphatidate cytidylyltransferase [Endomicrobiales bacterium]